MYREADRWDVVQRAVDMSQIIGARVVAPALTAASLAFAGTSDASEQNKPASTPTPAAAEQAPVTEKTERLIPDSSILLGSVATLEPKNQNYTIRVPQRYAGSFNAEQIGESEKNKLDAAAEAINEITDAAPFTRFRADIDGIASDESKADSINGNANLGQKSQHNLKLAFQRARVARAYLVSKLDNVQQLDMVASGKEFILSKSQIAKVEQIAAKYHLNRDAFLDVYNNGAPSQITMSDRDELAKLFPRGTDIKVSPIKEAAIDTAKSTLPSTTDELTAPKAIVHAQEPPANKGFNVLTLLIPSALLATSGSLLYARRRQKEKLHRIAYDGYDYAKDQYVGGVEKGLRIKMRNPILLMPDIDLRRTRRHAERRIRRTSRSVKRTMNHIQSMDIHEVLKYLPFMGVTRKGHSGPRRKRDRIAFVNGPTRTRVSKRKMRQHEAYVRSLQAPSE